MKNNLLVLLCLLSVLGFSQQKTEFSKIKKSELVKMNKISDFVKIEPKDFKSLSGEFMCKTEAGGTVSSQAFKSDTITDAMKQVFAKIAVGSKLYIDIYVNGLKPAASGKSNAQTSAFIIIQ